MFETPIPGVFYRLTWDAPPQDTICREATAAILEVTDFRIATGTLSDRNRGCWVALRRPAADARRTLGITLLADPSARSLNVSIQEFAFSLTRPSESTKRLADAINAKLRDRFPSATIAPFQAMNGFLAP
jgi:hypothetical protein